MKGKFLAAALAIALMLPCPSGRAAITEPIKFSDGTSMTTPLPLSLEVNGWHAMSFYQDLLTAVVTWNADLGETIFALDGRPGQRVVINEEAYEMMPGRRVGVSFMYPGKSTWFMFVSNPIDLSLRALVMEHELGHLLGLAHSKDGHDLMYPAIGTQHRLSVDDIASARKAIAGRKRLRFTPRP